MCFMYISSITMHSDIVEPRVNDERIEFALNNYWEYTDEIKETRKTNYEYNPDTNRWSIDRTMDSIDEINKNTSLYIPKWIVTGLDDEVYITKERDGIWTSLQCSNELIIEWIDDQLSYEEEYWENGNRKTYTQSIIDEKDGMVVVPIGVTERVMDILDNINIDYDYEDVRSKPSWNKIDTEWNFSYDLRDYQNSAVSEMLKGSCIAQMPTGAGKTVTSLKVVEMLSMPTLILVHRKELLHQWTRRIRSILGKEPGTIREDTREWKDITVGMIQTLSNTEHKIDDYDILIFDEVHRLPADTAYGICLRTNAYYRYGLSATAGENVREDNKGIKMVAGIGPARVNISPERLIEQGYLASPHFEWINVPKKECDFGDWRDEYRKRIVNYRTRNGLTAERVDEEMENGRRVLVDVKRIDHGENIMDIMDNCFSIDKKDDKYVIDRGNEFSVSDTVHGVSSDTPDELLNVAVSEIEYPVVWLNGEHPDEVRESVMMMFKEGMITGMVSTLLREGVDVPELDTVVLAGGQKSKIQLIQTIGRTLRPEGSKNSKIIDFNDFGNWVSDHTMERATKMREYYGEYFDKPDFMK